ncbi:MAG: NAD-dependent epimerase/dehydratase family protein [Candidatus Limiplasma sp.]|nr:NAD-dependent epimerase/dehydratase family protein [Candidatus Limiplasma sp.]
MEKLFILTGAAGNLGGNVCGLLSERGDHIRALVLPGDKTAERLSPGIQKIEGDLLDDHALERLFDVPANTEIYVIHMAAIVTTYPDFNQKIYDVNVKGTKNILHFCKRYNVRKFVYVSSASAIPEQPRGVAQKEISMFDPEKVLGFYAKTKAEATQAVIDAAKEGLNASSVYPTGVCGPGDFAFGTMTQVMMDCANEKLPAGIIGDFDIVDVRDVARGIVLCADKGKAGEGYILAGHLLTLKELFREIHLHSGVKEIKIMFPFWFMKMLLPFFEVYYKAKKQKPVFTSYSLYSLTRNNLYSREKAERELGYSVRPASETIDDTLSWLREIGKICKRNGVNMT